MKINTKKFIKWLEGGIELAEAGIQRYVEKEDYESALGAQTEKKVYEALLECICDPDFYGTEWMDKDE